MQYSHSNKLFILHIQYYFNRKHFSYSFVISIVEMRENKQKQMQQHTFLLHQGISISLHPHDIMNLANGSQMLNTLVEIVSKFGPEKLEESESFNRIQSILLNLTVPYNALISKNKAEWMVNLSKVGLLGMQREQFEMQIFIRLAAIKLEQKYRQIHNLERDSDLSSIQCKTRQIITLFDQLKIEQSEYSVAEFIRNTMPFLPSLQSDSFRLVLIDIVESFNQQQKFKDLYRQTPEPNVTPAKKTERAKLIRDILNISKSIAKTEAQDNTPANNGPRSVIFEKVVKPTQSRTLYPTNPMKFVFKEKRTKYGYF